MRFHGQLFLWAVLLAVTAGCQTFRSQPLSSATAGIRFESRTLDDPDLKDFLETNLHTNFALWPVKAWDFPALTLTAFFYHPSLDVARAQWAVSEGGVRTASARPNPTISISPEYNFNAASGVSPWIAGFNFDLPVETAGKRGYRAAQAKYLSEAARLNIGAVAWQVRKNLRDALIDFNSAGKNAALLEKQKELQTRLVEIVNLQLKAGTLAPFEISTAHLALHKVQLDLAAMQSQKAEALSRVAEALGLPLAALAGAGFLPAAFSTDDLSSPEIRRQALQNRSDLLGSLAEYAASQSALQLEIAKQYPDIHLGTGYQYDQGENKWSLIGASLELPLLNRNQGGIAEAKARREEAGAKFVALQARVIAEIDRALAVHRAAEEQLKLSATLLETRHRRRQSMEAQYKAGAIERLDFLTTEVEAGAIEVLQSDIQSRVARAFSDLEFAVQRPLASLQAMLTEIERNPRNAKEYSP